MGGAPRSFNGLVPPLFSFPQSDETRQSSTRQKRGGVPFLEKLGGVQRGLPERRGTVSEKNETKQRFTSQKVCDLATWTGVVLRLLA